MNEREQKFEKMLQYILENHETTLRKLAELKAEGRTKTVTYRQLMADKLRYEDMLALYRLHDILE